MLLLFYYDEYEVVNPLGSKTKKHKLGAFYFILLNLPHWLNSTLKHIHLIAVFQVADLKDDLECMNDVLQPVINDIDHPP